MTPPLQEASQLPDAVVEVHVCRRTNAGVRHAPVETTSAGPRMTWHLSSPVAG